MGIEDLIAAERERYVNRFAAALDELRCQEANVANEVLISINDEALRYPFRYFRPDALVANTDGTPRVSRFDLGDGETFQPCGFDFGTFSLEVRPFRWDDIQFAFDKPPSNQTQLEGWITRWLNVEDDWRERDDALSNAAHSFTRIENNDDWWYLTADFGTAPAQAAVEFLELLAFQGMKRIVMHSF